MSASVAQRPQDQPAAAPSKPRLRARVVRALSTVALVLVFAVAALMLVPGLLGYERYVITGGSMEPTIGKGSVVYDEVVPLGELEVGDIITFIPPPEYGPATEVTHRILDISPVPDGAGAPGSLQFRTKGDANADPDPWRMVPDQDELPRVEHHIEKLGYVYSFLSHRWVQLLLIGLPALVLTVLIVVALWREAGAAVAREQAEAAGEEGA